MPRGVTETTRAPQAQATKIGAPHIILARNATDADLARAKVEQVGVIIEREGLKFVVRSIYRDDLRRLVAACEAIGGGL